MNREYVMYVLKALIVFSIFNNDSGRKLHRLRLCKPVNPTWCNITPPLSSYSISITPIALENFGQLATTMLYMTEDEDSDALPRIAVVVYPPHAYSDM